VMGVIEGLPSVHGVVPVPERHLLGARLPGLHVSARVRAPWSAAGPGAD
jgi:hypothetical protein